MSRYWPTYYRSTERGILFAKILLMFKTKITILNPRRRLVVVVTVAVVTVVGRISMYAMIEGIRLMMTAIRIAALSSFISSRIE